MNQHVAKKLLLLTESMLIMAQEDDWQSLGEKEKERAKIIDQLSITHAQDIHTEDKQTIDILEQIITLNQVIHTLSKEQLHADKHAILALNKRQKVSSMYQDV
jgi:transcriptional/translational regulatory protein YebC/TACO1